MKTYIKTFALVALLFPAVLLAVETQTSVFVKPDTTPKQEVVNAFRSYKNISPRVSVPTAVEVPFDQAQFSIPVFAVYNTTALQFEPYYFAVNYQARSPQVQAPGSSTSGSNMVDGNYQTYAEFPLVGDSGRAEITLTYEKPVTSSSLFFALDNNVAMPSKISINAVVSGKDTVVVAPAYVSRGEILFPQTTASVWRVVFDYVQPLRISELKINNAENQTVTSALRFLAQPGASYQIYFDADRYVDTARKESADLFSNVGVVRVNAGPAILNPGYAPLDNDQDSVPDFTDNCITITNSDQKDADNNGRGDACEDYDRDGIVGALDNCKDLPNGSQEDTDGDGVGDICDNFENRVTERAPWLPWLGIGVAGLVILGLFVVVLKQQKPDAPVE